jgi:sugar-specific transcriptional regulator TrmB
MFVLNGNSEKVLKVLRSCGLTEYESKAYFTLLLTDREKMWELSKKSSVPQSKIYLVVDSLKNKGLVDLSEESPKTASPRPLEPYLSKAINSKQKEISKLVDYGNLIREIVYSLKPVATRYKDKYRVFEPKHRRR